MSDDSNIRGKVVWRMTPVVWAWGLVCLLITVLIGILSTTALQLDTGPGVLRVMLNDSTLGWLGWEHERIYDAPGARQADFWIKETDRILSEHPTSEMARGAAWMLDSPGLGFIHRHLEATNVPQLPVTVDEAIAREKSQFEHRVGTKCAEIAEVGITLAPNDPRAWRTRALLLFRVSDDAAERESREPDWRKVLDEAARHDPHNALYDYLIADKLWRDSTTFEFPNDEFRVIVTDQEQAHESSRYFERAQRQTYAQDCEDDYRAIAAFLAHSDVPLHEHPDFIGSRLLQAREMFLGYRLLRMQLERPKGESPKDRLQHLRSCLQLADKISASGDLTGIDTAGHMRQTAAASLGELLRVERDSFTENEAQEIRNELVAVHVRNKVWEAAANDLESTYAPTGPQFSAMLRGMVAHWCQSSAVLLTMITIAKWSFTRISPVPANQCPRQFGVVRHGVCWLLAFATSFVFLGLAPAEIVSVHAQQVVSNVLIAVAPVAVLGLILAVALWRRKWRFSLLAFLVFAPVIGAAVALGLLHRFDVIDPDSGYHVPARMEDGVDPTVMQAAASMFPNGSLPWAVIQWNAYSGATVAIVLALVSVGGWYFYRGGRSELGESCNFRSRTRGMVGAIARSAAYGALLTFIAFLAVAPVFLRDLQADYETKMAWYNELQERRDLMESEINAFRSDPARMKELRQRAEDWLDQILTGAAT